MAVTNRVSTIIGPPGTGKIVRVYAKRRQQLDNKLDKISLHELMNGEGNDAEFDHLRRESLVRQLSKKEQSDFKAASIRAQIAILRKHRVVVSTLSTTATEAISQLQPYALLIDEGAQCMIPEGLIAIATGAKKLTIFGDPHQLPPLIISRRVSLTSFSST
ncbi:hypothetical protein WR25_17377 [Diploscapter pachys]|uniref:DNA2/NAM7 helicase helicase domain-containing protein n=1 Tax=Diploscapter pachys TaxID=2018661 RepID=A0A2A2M451_9BILA|nr:hypothetical protein WR25_17377 [Diploscapter pachys]